MQNTKVSELITIDRRSKRSYDIQIKESIKALILDHTFYYQDVLPSPLELATALHIDPSQVESAYQLLANENHIKATTNGYEVSFLELTNYFFDRNTAIYDAILALGLTPSIECVERKVVELSKHEAQSYGFVDERRFLYINRIYKGNGRPLIILENYLPIEIFPDINERFIDHLPLNEFLYDTYGIIAQESHRVTRAVNLTSSIAAHLNEPKGNPSVSSTNHVYDQSHRLIDFGRSHSISSYYFQSIINHPTQHR
ncbi:MAG: GntR family transcriptional regulator [Bacillus subtilis]|nr:GntR family transcriptional regulator [Bacillus subtilis]